jgi:hypothetical protein
MLDRLRTLVGLNSTKSSLIFLLGTLELLRSTRLSRIRPIAASQSGLGALILVAFLVACPADAQLAEFGPSAKQALQDAQVDVDTVQSWLEGGEYRPLRTTLDSVDKNGKDRFGAIWRLRVSAAKQALKEPKAKTLGIAWLQSLLDECCDECPLPSKLVGEVDACLIPLTDHLLVMAKLERAVEVCRAARSCIQKRGDEAIPVRVNITLRLARILETDGRTNEAESELNELLLLLESKLAESNVIRLSFVRLLRACEGYPSLSDATKPMAEKLLLYYPETFEAKGPQVDELEVYSLLLSHHIRSSARTDPLRAMKQAEELLRLIRVASKAATKDEWRTLDSIEFEAKQSLQHARRASLRQDLINTNAPEFLDCEFIGVAPVTLAQLRGQVVYVCCFDALSEQNPEEMASLEAFHRKYLPYGLHVLGVAKSRKLFWDTKSERPVFDRTASLQDEVAMFQQFRVHHVLSFGIALMPKADFHDHFHYEGAPLHILIDRSGKIRYVQSGLSRELRDEIRQSIELICSE